MSNEINLLLKKEETKKKGIRKPFLVSIFFFVAVFIPSCFVLLYNFSLNNQISNLTENQNEIETKIKSYSVKNAKIIRLQDRLNNIEGSLRTRVNLDSKISAMLKFIPENVSVNEFSYNQKKLSIELKSPNLSDLSKINENIEESESINGIKSIDLVTLEKKQLKEDYLLKLNFNF